MVKLGEDGVAEHIRTIGLWRNKRLADVERAFFSHHWAPAGFSFDKARLVKDKAYRAVSWLPLSSPAFDKSFKPYAYDPEKAKKLLAEAGYPNGFEFEWTTSQNESWGLPIVEAVIPMLARVGIKAKPKLVQYIRNTTTLADGDISPEGLRFIPASASPTGVSLLAVGHEVTGSVAVYQIKP